MDDLFSELDKWQKKIAFLKSYEAPQIKKDSIDSLEQLRSGNNNSNRLSRAEYHLKKNPNNPKCAVCGSVLVIRTNRTTQQEFWACSNYPDCKHTERKK
jgi:hypothetical protein